VFCPNYCDDINQKKRRNGKLAEKPEKSLEQALKEDKEKRNRSKI